jgi:putative endonuclease
MGFYFVYILLSLKDGNLYFGQTNNLVRRYNQHQNGENVSTKNRRPFELIFFEAYRHKSDALKRERYFKTTKGKTVLRIMLKNFFENR